MVDNQLDLCLTAERSVLGTLLLHAGAVADVAQLRPADFYSPRHQLIFEAIVDAYNGRASTDPLVVGEELSRRNRLDEAGGIDQLLDLAEQIVTAAGIVDHAAIVKEHSERRRIRSIVQRAQVADADGADAESMRSLLATAAASDVAATAGRRQTAVRSLAEIESMPPMQWLVQHLLPQPGVGFLVGPPNCGKTAIALDVAMRVLHGLDFAAHRTSAGSVLYAVGEGVGAFGLRSRAWRQERGLDVPSERYFAVATGLPPLSAAAGLTELRSAVVDLQRQHGHAVSLVVIDTLSAHWAESEDRSEFAAPAMAALQALAAEFGLCVLLLHHERKPQENQRGGGALAALRGSGAWTGSADFVLSVRGEPEAIEIVVAKQRDAERGAPIRLRMQRVDLGIGADGEPRTSVVVVPAAALPAAPEAFADASAAIKTERIVDAVRTLAGTPTTRDDVCRAAHLRVTEGRTLVDLAVAAGRIRAVQAGRRTIYSIPA